MDERKVVDYFVIAGLPTGVRQVDDLPSAKSHSKTPITDIAVIFPALGETLPDDYTVINKTPTGLLADLNHGSLRSPEVFLCFRRGRDKPPLVDIGVMYEGKERILADSEIVDKSLKDHCANVNNSASKTFLTFRRASPTMPCNSLVVTDIAVIITNKGETVPHAFCCIKKNLNRGLVGSDVYICYKKSVNRPSLISYKPGILLRYPFENRPNLPLPESVPMFCMPMGCSLEKWPKTAQQPVPIFSTFVLTVSDAAEKLYGSAVTFYEPYAIKNLTDEQKSMLSHKEDSEDWTYHINKCICLLSRWPFFDTYERFLMFLYDMSRDSTPHSVSIERFITYFLEDIPFPGPQRPRILVQLSQLDRVILTQPEDLPLPRSGAGFRQLLIHLGPDNCLLILLCALTEQKILVHSLRPDVLTAVAEAISMIMFPFKWQCPYIPLCPLGLAEVLHAPLPFLIGVDSRFFDLYDPPSDVNCVDLDTNNITFCDEKRNLNIKLLPKKAGRALRSTLEDMYQKLNNFILQSMDPSNQSITDDSIDKEFQQKKKEQKLELEIQEAFLKFMATILRGYRNFLLPITKAPTIGTTDTNSLFDLQGFLRTRDKAHNKFFSLVTKTQMFIRFIEERSFVSDMDAGLAFFDECTEKVELEDENNYRLLEVEGSHHSEHTVFIPPPESQHGQRFHYDEFTLDVERFKTYLSSTDGLLKTKDKSSSNRLSNSGAPPGSPMARRTKYEIKVAQKLARKWALTPKQWANCLLATCYSIWFIHLPSYVLVTQNPSSTLGYAYDMLIKLHRVKILLDEICYRVMMQLCGVYRLPVVAVLLLMNMKREHLQPNAITYGFYNRAVLEATWPSGSENSSQLLWNKLRNVIMGAALFRRAGLNASKRRLSSATEDSLSTVDPVMNCGSRTSIDSAESLNHKSNVSDTPLADSEGFAAFERFRSRVGSIVRPSGLPLLSPVAAFKQQPFDSSAGLLITGQGGPLKGESIDLEQLDVLASPVFPPPSCSSNPKRYFRSGSCTEFSHNQLRQPPTSPPKNTVDSTFKLLTRSESFAHDAGILAKLNMLKLESSTVTPPEPLQRDRIKNTPPNPMGGPKPWQPKVLFKRRRSLTLKNFKDPTASDSYESSNENLGSTGSGGRGSFEDIYNNMDTPKRNRLFNALGARLNKLNPDRHSTGTIDTTGSGDQSFDAAKSPVKSPSRTPVTENDPLGALDLGENEIETAKVTTVSRATSEIELDQSGAPVLFDRRSTDWNSSVVRSATFINEQESDDDIDSSVDPEFRKPIHRSSTMPTNVGDAPFQSGFSSFKIPSFTRYSPARFSLRKAADKINAQMIENAFTSLSPSSLTSKKSNELIMGGLSSLKSAATSVAKKFDEIKGAISANSTPNKSNSLRGTLERDACLMEDESEYADDMQYARRKISSEFSPLNRGYGDSWGSSFLDRQGDTSGKGSTTNLGDASQWTSLQNVLFPNPKPHRDSSVPFAMEVIMTTCSKCHNCLSVLYDEEIMAGWTPEDSNLNTKCQFCEKATVPLLTVTVIDYRNTPVPQKERKVSTVSLGNTLGASRTSLADSSDEQPKTCEPIAVPYLNPLVLRKELESILAAEGDSSLTQSKFVDEHPIIYWNMVWMFTRINIESHMFNLVLGFAGAVTNPHPSWANVLPSSVLISTMWHNPRLHDEVGQPMYLSWNNINNQPSSLVSALVTDHKPVQSSTMEKVISYLQCNDLVTPLKFLAVERQKLKGRGHSLYREILFLGITALGRENIDQGIFDKEYQLAFDKLPDKDPKLYLRCDQPISLGSIYCRQTFRPLDL